MTTTISDLLGALRAKESTALRAFGDVGHQGMIGDIYEAMTRNLSR